MSISYRKARIKTAPFSRRLLSIAATGIILLVVLMLTKEKLRMMQINYSLDFKNLKLPPQNKLSIFLQNRNLMKPMNSDLYPNLADNHIIIVLYVHNRPQYLQIAIDSLSKVSGIEETLLIISHDGYFKEMNKIIESIKFCQVKQIFAPFSPHIYPTRFPGSSKFDCKSKEDPSKMTCRGNPDQYGSFRSPKIVSLKHHWWWMMNTVWDGLKETSDNNYSRNILFIEEDHFIYPNAYRNLHLLIELKNEKCPHCYAVNLAPANVLSRGEEWDSLIAEKIGNIGYSFNRTVWRKIHKKAREFCLFDEYNWDITMWAAVYPSFGGPVYTLRGPRTSAVHFGECGLHQGQGGKTACVYNGGLDFEVKEIDRVANIDSEWGVFVREQGKDEGYKNGFKGWGGWGDVRDRQLCLDFSKMYRN
ncbi:hypothetical protein ABFX02_10G168300 [Erythranthe guttata]